MIKILFGFGFFFLWSGLAPAQQKMGYVNTDKILKNVPEYQGVKQQLRKLGERWHQQVNAMQQRIDTLKQKYKAKKILLTKKLRDQKKQQIEQLIEQKKQYIDQKFGAEGDYFKKQKQLLEPIQRKVYKAITTVARQNNFDFVFDRAQNSSLLYGQTQWNLNRDVLQQLGITLNNKNSQ